MARSMCAMGRGFLETESTWGDFILQAQIKTNGKHLNSGIFFRAMPGTAEEPSNGYEAQVQNAYEQKRPDENRLTTGPAQSIAGSRRVASCRMISNGSR